MFKNRASELTKKDRFSRPFELNGRLVNLKTCQVLRDKCEHIFYFFYLSITIIFYLFIQITKFIQKILLLCYFE